MSESDRRGMAMDELEPDYDDLDSQPKTLTKSRHHKNVYWLAGRHGEQVESDIMFVTSSVEEDEMTRVKKSLFGYSVTTDAEYLKGPTGVVKDVALRAGIDIDKEYYTALVKWLLPRTKRAKPPVKVLKYGIPVLLDEIKRVRPKIIVCMGKQVFDQLSDRKISFDDAHGAWFWSDEHQAHMYVTYAPYVLVTRPEMYETFRIDFQEIARKRDIINGVGVEDAPVRWTEIRDEASLRSWVLQMQIEQRHLYALDCEWHGRQCHDADLRSLQMAWTESDAMVTLFRNEQNQWAFEFLPETAARVKASAEEAFSRRKDEGIPTTYEQELKVARYKAAGAIIAPIISDPRTELIGHHFAADAVMLETWLDIDTYQKCVLDTEFAQQTVDESSELDLERGIAMKYTTLGFYSQALNEWKRANRKLCVDGYGYIPESIIVPYSIYDVIAPFRAYPKIRRQLEAQKLWEYYRDIHNPFVTDVFTGMTMCGLPMDRERMDDLREVFHFARRHLEVSLKRNIHQAAKVSVFGQIVNEFDMDLALAHAVTNAGSAMDALTLVKQAAAVKNIKTDPVRWMKRLNHMFESADFNIRSPEMMRRWLYDVEGLTPIKSTNQKAKGLPSMAWEKVLELPEDRQKFYVPAVDKQTIQILSTKLPLLDELLSLNAVGNVCKAFLKEAEIIPIEIDDCIGDGEDEGEKFDVREHGLHAWLSTPFDDGVCRVLGMMSCTETSRPRAWQPNCLNWPSYVSERIGKAVVKALQEAHETGDLPDALVKWLSARSEKDIPSIRSCVKAPPGWVFVESDYKTAEMVALSVISGDAKLMRILFESDPEWARLKEKKYGEDKVRVSWAPTSETGIPPHLQRDDFLMHVWKDGKCLGAVTEDDLSRNADGSVAHANFDIHWSVVERTYEMPRELMVTKIHRNAGKVLNFCVMGDAPVQTDIGVVRMDSISDGHKLWDGLSWVSHEGIIKQGIRSVFEYDGVSATPEHVVYTEELGPVPLVDAAVARLRIVRSATDSGLPAAANGHGAYGGLERSYLERRVRSLREAFSEVDDQLVQGVGDKLRVSRAVEIQRRAGEDAGRSLSDDGAAMPQGHALLLRELQRAWDQSADDARGVHTLGFGYLAGGIIPRERFRQDGQRRALRDNQSQVGYALSEPYEHASVGYMFEASSQRFESESSRVDLHCEDCVEQASGGLVGGEDPGTLQRLPASDLRDEGLRLEGQCCARSAAGKPEYGIDGEARNGAGTARKGPEESMGGSGGEACCLLSDQSTQVAGGPPECHIRDRGAAEYDEVRNDGGADSGAPQSAYALKFVKTCNVYDVVNAGPNHRFTVCGRLVSNSSAYGASPASLDRKIESDTGVKPEEGTGEKGLEAIATRQPRATEFLEEMARVPKERGYYRAASGRIRHCVLHGKNTDIGWRTRNAQESALGREMRNWPMQESVASTSARACKWAQAVYRSLGMKARVMTCLYDSVVTLCPLEERFVVNRLHTYLMSVINTWTYEDAHGKRTLQYGVDNEFNYRWSTRPSKDELALLDDESWCPTPDRLKWAMTYENWELLVA